MRIKLGPGVSWDSLEFGRTVAPEPNQKQWSLHIVSLVSPSLSRCRQLFQPLPHGDSYGSC